jgi:hypothetical protein
MSNKLSLMQQVEDYLTLLVAEEQDGKALEALVTSIVKKENGIAYVIADLNSAEEKLSGLITHFTNKKRTISNAVARLKEQMLYAINTLGIEPNLVGYKHSIRKSLSVIPEVTCEEVGQDYTKSKVVQTVDKKKLLDAYKAGDKSLEKFIIEEESLQIR